MKERYRMKSILIILLAIVIIEPAFAFVNDMDSENRELVMELESLEGENFCTPSLDGENFCEDTILLGGEGGKGANTEDIHYAGGDGVENGDMGFIDTENALILLYGERGLLGDLKLAFGTGGEGGW